MLRKAFAEQARAGACLGSDCVCGYVGWAERAPSCGGGVTYYARRPAPRWLIARRPRTRRRSAPPRRSGQQQLTDAVRQRRQKLPLQPLRQRQHLHQQLLLHPHLLEHRLQQGPLHVRARGACVTLRCLCHMEATPAVGAKPPRHRAAAARRGDAASDRESTAERRGSRVSELGELQ
jgi:hypothetical protein